jgi:tetraacyldisaccharide 4'-kinase
MERLLNALWYGRGPRLLAWVLAPLAALFVAIAALRRWAYRHGVLKVSRLRTPVVVIGNLTVGGSGKTPLVIWLARELTRHGRRVGIVARGYGGTADQATLLPVDGDPAVFGDEPVLIRSATGLPVVVGRQRAAAASLLERQAGVDVILSDDGLQHYALARAVEVVVIDAQRGLGNGWRLPAGPLRESVARLAQVDVVVRRDPAAGRDASPDSGAVPQVDMRVVPHAVRALVSGISEPLAVWRGRSVHAIAGIGHPQRFFDGLRAAGLTTIEHAAPDHHRWQPQELQFGDSIPVLMTAKDAVKCRSFARAHWYCVEAGAAFEPAAAQALIAKVLHGIEVWKS